MYRDFTFVKHGAGNVKFPSVDDKVRNTARQLCASPYSNFP